MFGVFSACQFVFVFLWMVLWLCLCVYFPVTDRKKIRFSQLRSWYFLQSSCGLSVLATQHMNHSFRMCLCELLSALCPSMWTFSLFVCERFGVLRVCWHVQRWWNCVSSSSHRLLLFLLLLLMLSHFLWAPDKPAKQGENRALYWDACQDSPRIYGQQTVFITQPREAE